ncbi:MAG: glycosyltransferase [Armatimonadetes bacterium]|nr:glycosyltransferase [Armatimonadota bacterium]
MDISVVIPTYNRKETLELVLASMVSQTFSRDRFEVIVADSNSSDGTDLVVSRFQSEMGLRYLRQENRGRSGARNLGIRSAGGRIVLFTDADIIADPHLLEEHWNAHQEYGRGAVVGWEVRVQSEDELAQARQDPEARVALHPPGRKLLSWLYFLTGNASAPRNDLISVGLFDEAFQQYGWEDIELGYRLAKAGVAIRYNPLALNYHFHPQTLEERCSVAVDAGRSAVRFWRKHRDWRIRWLLGMNPFSTAFFSMFSPKGTFLRALRSRLQLASCDRGGPFLVRSLRELLIQYHYSTGVRGALRELIKEE